MLAVFVDQIPSGLGDLFADIASAPVEPVLSHDGEILTVSAVGVPDFHAAAGGGLLAEEGFNILDDFIFDAAAPAELAGKGHLGVAETLSVSHFGKVFGMSFSETLHKFQRSHTVAEGIV